MRGMPSAPFSTVEFHGLPAIRWESRDGAAAIATLNGAHLVSWIPAGAGEALFVSERSPFEPGRAIRGGVPVCFPQFADRGPLPQHGFARNLPWRFEGVETSEGRATASFVLEGTEATLAAWPHPFRMTLAVGVGGERLDLALRVVNPGTDAFTFTAALHTYLRVGDASLAQLEGLAGVRYLNRGENDTHEEMRTTISAAEAIDRVYFAPPPALVLRDGPRTIRLAQEGFTDTVVWNPGAAKCAAMADMEPDGWRRMWCVEAAAIEPGVALAPGASWSASQSIRV